MSGKTHAIVGANAIWIAALLPVGDTVILLGIIGALGGLLPDIDATKARIHYVAKGAFSAFRNMGKHRGFFHSLLAIILFLVFGLVALSQFHPLVPFALAIGYASHILIDMLNKPGVQFFFPNKKRYRIVPKFLATNVGGPVDNALFIVASLTFVLFLTQAGIYQSL